MYFKLTKGNEFIGIDSRSKDLTLVSRNDAMMFRIQDTDHAGEKKLLSTDKKRAFTEKGFWGFRKWYGMGSPDRRSRQGIKIVFWAPNKYILMRDDSCLSKRKGIFRKVSCKNPGTIDKFRICKNKRCNKKNNDWLRNDIDTIMSILMNSNIYGNKGNDDGLYRDDGYSASSSSMSNDVICEVNCYSKNSRGNGNARGGGYYTSDSSSYMI